MAVDHAEPDEKQRDSPEGDLAENVAEIDAGERGKLPQAGGP
jgi:hypothetical protein